MSTTELHKAQASILRTLRHNRSVRYSVLRHPTGMDSDVFKFHLRKLQELGYVNKLRSGEYTLSPSGKEFANNLSKLQRTTQKQPKLSMSIIVKRNKQYLFQQRFRNPYYGFWGCITGPVQWGEQIEDTAGRELEKQTGLTAKFSVRAFYRKTDFNSGSNMLLEDKLFAIVEATNVSGNLVNEWAKGLNAWMSVDDLKAKERYFTSTCAFIEMMRSGVHYRSANAYYAEDEY
jgi:ADP-ribose pyrophosphatase YjhB (NUDIX family)